MSIDYLSFNESENSFLLSLSSSYSQLHGWLSLLICLIGIPFNLFIVIVLTKTKIASFAINLILICIALSDTVTMFVYLPYCVHFYIFYSNAYSVEPSPERDTYFWIIYSLVNIFISVTFHSFSIWFTVYLAIYRYFYIKKSFQTNKQITSINKCFKYRLVEILIEKPFICVFTIILFCVFYCLPTYFYPTIENRLYKNVTLEDKTDHLYVYYINQSEYDRNSKGFIFKASFYAQALFAKIIPCILVTTFISLLIYYLIKIQRKKNTFSISRTKKLHRKDETDVEVDNEMLKQNVESIIVMKEYNFKQTDLYLKASKSRKRSSQENIHTNLMLLIVCILFLSSEFPQAVLIMFSIFDEKFHDDVYKPLGDLMDILVLINNSINFILYCTMSKAFRITFKSCFKTYDRKNQHKLSTRNHIGNLSHLKVSDL